jgi:polar amino acid transport system permease protein
LSIADSMIAPQPAPPAAARRFTIARLAGIVFMALWAALFASIVITAVEDFDQEKFFKYAPAMLRGLGVTLELVATSLVLGAILSLPLTFARMQRSGVLASIAYGYVYLFRGTPLIMQVFLIYYGLGSFRPALSDIGLWWFFKDAYNCALLAFSLNTAAYQAEILRGAIESVARGQWEGAAALGLSKWQALRKIIAPQALIVALRPYGNELILMIKGSAIVALITVFDLMGETRRAYSRSFDFQSYVWAALIYLSIVEILRHAIDWIERIITKHLVR